MTKRAWIGAVAVALVAMGCSCSNDMTADAGPDGSEPAVDAYLADGGARCGDGTRQRPEEACDDGNTDDGDGCSADCSSDETCGNSVLDVAADELCDDGNEDDGDGCRGDCLSDYRCGNGVRDLVADGADEDEVCDDGNTSGGDGCSTACDSDESCGNSVVDVLAGEVCDDGNTDDTDDCSADCSFSRLCGNGTMDGVEECDDGNTDDADGCSAICQVERCGNGRVDVGEDCDDGNADDADGCTAACGFTCSADTECADTEPCNGAETCMNAGTATSQCVAGTPLAEGASCGGGLVCTGGVCATEGCGDGTVTAPEQCDDSNVVSGDGCDADCQWTCSGASDCADANACNGAETCTMPGTIMSRCAPGTAAADGTACDRDAMPATRDICRTSMCLASTCGDGFVDSGATPVEQCDDGNTTSGDGCSATCQTEVAVMATGFRVTDLNLVSPRIVASVLICIDATGQVNGLIDDEVGMNYSLHFVATFRPLNPSVARTPTVLHLNAMCDAAPTPDSCGPDPSPDTMVSDANNRSAGAACYSPDTALVGTYPGLSDATAPCFVTDEETLSVVISGITIPLERGRVAATYDGTPVNRLINGTVTGFLSERAAADIMLPDDLPLVGGDRLYQHLRGGNRQVMDSSGMMISDGCGGGDDADRRDPSMPMDPVTNPRGFWFFLDFDAARVTWTEP